MTLPLHRYSPIGLLAIMAMLSWAPHAAADTQSTKSGRWSDPTTWSSGLPDASDAVTISAGTTVIYDLASGRVAGLTVEGGATLRFHPDQDGTLETDENVLVLGRLEMRPKAPDNDAWRNSIDAWRPYFIHTLRFINVDERAFVGGGMDPLASDVGLWVRGDGVLDIAGTQKTGWTRLAGAARKGDTDITLQAAPIGWRVGDRISIVPTQPPAAGSASYTGFDERTIDAVSGERVAFSVPLARDHPDVVDPFSGKVYTAEVLNLSRNVRIEGTGNGSASFQPSANGRAHINIRSAAAQSVRYAELVLLGPRKADGGYTDSVTGRYPLHFHHNGDGSRGSLVEGVVVRQSGNRAFVPHASDGITFRDVVAYDIWEEAYWWDASTRSDPSNQSHDILYDRAVAAIVKDDPSFRGYAMGGFRLETGRNNAIRNSVAVGNTGNSTASGFHWPESANLQNDNVWEFNEGNVAHNNKTDGIFVWQNDGNPHVIEDFVAYHNGGPGIEHGAYNNRYVYHDVSLVGNSGGSILLHAAPWNEKIDSDGYNYRFGEISGTDQLRFTKHTGGAGHPVLFRNCVFPSVRIDDRSDGGTQPTKADFVSCAKLNGSSLEPADFTLASTLPGMTIRVQRANGSAYRIDQNGTVTTIPAFYEIDGPAPPPPAPKVPTASLSAAPGAIDEGQSSTLTWSSTNADSCQGTAFSTGSSTSGNAQVSPVQTTTYRVACAGAGGTASAQATVTVAAAPPPPADGTEYSLWTAAANPGTPVDSDTGGVNLGVKFRVSQPGQIAKIRFWKGGSQNGGTHVGKIWTSQGQQLGSVTFTGETATGWQVASFQTPISIQANMTYVASVHMPQGRYAASNNYFTSAVTSGPLTAPADGAFGGQGVYRYGSANQFPNQTWRASNYWIDVIFQQ